MAVAAACCMPLIIAANLSAWAACTAGCVKLIRRPALPAGLDTNLAASDTKGRCYPHSRSCWRGSDSLILLQQPRAGLRGHSVDQCAAHPQQLQTSVSSGVELGSGAFAMLYHSAA